MRPRMQNRAVAVSFAQDRQKGQGQMLESRLSGWTLGNMATGMVCALLVLHCIWIDVILQGLD